MKRSQLEQELARCDARSARRDNNRRHQTKPSVQRRVRAEQVAA